MKTLDEVLKDWEAVIGLEVHAELTTLKTKMFCGCTLEYGAEPNTHTCPVCLGLPGALPVPNKAAIESIILAGLATNCDIEKRSMFYRKSYMYPDMSKNYQITQGPVAFCMRGFLDIELDAKAACERLDVASLEVGSVLDTVQKTEEGYVTRIGITRIHMEEDAGKMIHLGGSEGRIAGATHSLVDYNRAGTPLIELVTEPDLRTPEEARLFMQKLRQIYLAIGISDCSMEEGSLRCDGNISLRRRGTKEFGTKTELKNMNSFKNLHDGLAYEICRQAEVLERGGVITQETRHWDPAAKRTVLLRSKEALDDYRLFPDPDMAPFDLSDEFIESVRVRLPELPDQKVQRYKSMYGLSSYDARLLVQDAKAATYFESCMTFAAKLELAKPLANLVINDIAAYLNEHAELGIDELRLTPQRAVELVSLVLANDISSKQAKEVFAFVLEEDKDPSAIVAERSMKQISDVVSIEKIAQEVFAAFPEKVSEYRSGKQGLIGFFVGQCMQKTKGQGNPRVIKEVIGHLLEP